MALIYAESSQLPNLFLLDIGFSKKVRHTHNMYTIFSKKVKYENMKIM